MRSRTVFARLSVALLALTLLAAPATGAESPCGPDCDYYLIGNAADVTTETAPGILLAGGGTDQDEAMRWMIEKSGGGDFVVIRSSGSDGYNPYVFSTLGGVDSVESFVIKSRAAAFHPRVAEAIRNAEALFIAGGNQANYVNYWKDTPVEAAIHYLANEKRVVIGGTSAGTAILSEIGYSALFSSITSPEALANPYSRDITLERDFLKLPHLSGIVTDQHFGRRDRMGRTLAFMARTLADGWVPQARAIAIDEATTFALEPDGTGRVIGQSMAYFLSAGTAPEVAVPGQPLTFRDVNVYRIGHGQRFDLTSWTGEGGLAYTLSVENGAVTSSHPGGTYGDDQAPVLSVAVPEGWINAPSYTAAITATDNVGFGSITAPVTRSGSGRLLSTTYTVKGEGEHTIAAAAVDYTGSRGEAAGYVRIDLTPPTVALTGEMAYTVDQQIVINCMAADALSGLAAPCGGLDQPAYRMEPGSHTFTVTVADLAGNTAEASLTYTVTVSLDSLAALTERLVAQKGVAASLVAKLKPGHNLEPFIHELEAQAGKHVSADDAAALIALARSLMSQ